MISVVISTQWDAATRQTADLAPASASGVLMEWDIDPPPIDAAVPDVIARPIAAALTSLGQVAFRWSGKPTWPATQAQIITAPERTVLQRAIESMNHTWPADVVVTRSLNVAMKLFDFDWDAQGQAVLVLGPSADETDPVLARLARARTWRDFVLTPPVVALVTPIVDGGGVVIAAASAQGRTRIIEAMAAAFRTAGIAIREAA
jgi:hypothetical protein